MRRLLPLLVLLVAVAARAQTGGAPPPSSVPAAAPGADPLMSLLAPDGSGAAGNFLPVGRAFRLAVGVAGPDRLTARWRIASGYYLYRDRMRFSLAPVPGVGLATPVLGPASEKDDAYFGRVAVYYDAAEAGLPLRRSVAAPTRVRLKVIYQGCAEAGLCYPPVTREFELTLPAAGADVLARAAARAPQAAPAALVPRPSGPDAARPSLPFERVTTPAELDAALAQAAARRRPALLDYYADWCLPCRHMDRITFAAPAVRAALAGTVLLRADVSANDDADRALLARFGLAGPPAVLFFDPSGRELRSHRLVGYLSPDRFRAHLATLGRPAPASQ